MSSLVFIDSRVQDHERLIAGLAPDAQVVILDPALDGVAQIAAALAGASDLDSIHVVSHGSAGTLYLGSTVLTQDNLEDYEDELAQIGASLSEGGDLLLYGCNVGAGGTGEAFIASLADYTGADVAASDDATGSAALGADWQLEILTGAIESQLAVAAVAQDTYAHALDTITGNENANDLPGTEGNDSIAGLGGDDTLRGFAGNDTLDGGTGGDTMQGGTGNDHYIIDDFSDEVVEAADSGIDSIVTDQGITLPDHVENLTYNNPTVGGGFFGNALDNVITGNHLNNTMDGNDGVDTVSYAYETNAVTIDIDLVFGFASGSGEDTLSDFENAVGGSGADHITGNELGNVLNGNGGADTLTGGFGGDTYVVDNLGDSVVETSNDLPPAAEDVGAVGDIIDTVVALIDYNLSGVEFVENVTLSGTATSGIGNELNNILTGNGLANTLSGLANNDTLNGGAGNDTLMGGTGADNMAGGTNDDTYVVDATGDAVTELASAGLDLIQSSISIATLAANVEKLTLTGGAKLNGTGNTLANTLTGNAGANVLKGAAGKDTLAGSGGGDTLGGGSGSDRLTGGTGTDKFDFNAALSATTNVDRITDFNGDDDRIRLDNDFFTAFATVNAALAKGAFYKGAGETEAHDANDRIIYNTTSGRLYYDADGAGGKDAKLFAILDDAPALTNADFFIVA